MSSYYAGVAEGGGGGEDQPLLFGSLTSPTVVDAMLFATTGDATTTAPPATAASTTDIPLGAPSASSRAPPPASTSTMTHRAKLPSSGGGGGGGGGSGGNRFPSPTRQQQAQGQPQPQSQQQQQQGTSTKRVAKPTRPRKAISEFRKKTRVFPRGWQGRVGVHVQVDEINIEQLCLLIKTQLPDWDVIDYFDAMRLWQTTTTASAMIPTPTNTNTSTSELPPYASFGYNEQWNDWPVSEGEDEETDTNTRNAATDPTNTGTAATTITSSSTDMDATRPEVYLFSFGAAVFWNFPSEEFESKFLKEKILVPFAKVCGNELTPEEIEAAKDEMAFCYDKQFYLRRDVASLETRETGERLAVSFALAKSSLLTVYEERVQKTIDRNSHIPEEMVKNGRLHMTRQQISREVGRMLLVKHGINLDQSLIDTPEEFWEDDRFEATYEAALKYFEVNKRLTLVNNRLNMIGDLHSVLAEENASSHASTLEWIIIFLIVIEVLLDLLHLGIY